MSTNASMFRLMVVVSAVAYFIGAALPYLPLPLYTEQQLKLLAFSGEGALFPNTWEFWMTLAVIQIALSVGLFYWKARARDLFLVLVTFELFLAPIGGVVVTLPYESYFFSLSWLLAGAVLGLAYFSELKAQFR